MLDGARHRRTSTFAGERAIKEPGLTDLIHLKDPNQELIGIGVANLCGTFFSAYPATGSFSRSAINSKAGARTPLSGWFTGIVVIIALC